MTDEIRPGLPRIITYEWLKARIDECSLGDTFRKVFGEGVELTRAALITAAETDQQPRWFTRFLNDGELEEFNRRAVLAIAELPEMIVEHSIALANCPRCEAEVRRAAQVQVIYANIMAGILGLE